MRITNNMLVNNMLNHISNNMDRMQKYQNQLATGKKISVPSDDPVVAARSLKLKTDVSEMEQFKRNANDAYSWLDVTESSIGKLNEVMQRTRELMVQGANKTYGSDDMKKIREEVIQLKEQAIKIANTSYAGRYVFSGYKTDKALMDEAGKFSISVRDDERMMYDIGIGDDINVNVPGGDLFNNGGNANFATAGTVTGGTAVTLPLTITAGVNDQLMLNVDGEAVITSLTPGTYTDTLSLGFEVENRINTATATAADVSVSFDSGRLVITSGILGDTSHVIINTGSSAATSLGVDTNIQVDGETGGSEGKLIKLYNDFLYALNLGANGMVGELLSDMDTQMDNVMRVRSEVGGKMNRVELTLNRIEADNYTFTKLLSKNEDVDMAEAIMNMQTEENVYKSSLAGGAKIIQPSLIDFLR